MDGHGTTRSRWAVLLFGAAVVAVALNQRPAVDAVAPLLGDLRADTGLSPAMAGLRQPLARQVTLFIGLQSVQFYSLGAWLPPLLADAGVPVSEGGLLLEPRRARWCGSPPSGWPRAAGSPSR